MVGGLEITGIPWVGDVAGIFGIIQQPTDFSVRVAAGQTVQRTDVAAFHAENIVAAGVILGGKDRGAFGGAVDAVGSKHGGGGGIDAAALFLPAGSGRGNGERSAPPPDDILHDKFCHRRTADVAQTDKHNVQHLSKTPFVWMVSLS